MSDTEPRGGGDVAAAIEQIAHALHIIQTDATQAPIGSLEVLAQEVRKGCDNIAAALGDIADALKGRRE